MLEHGALLLLCARRQFFFLSSNYTFFLCFCFISSVFLQHLQRLVDSLVLLLLSPFYETLHAWEAAAGPALLGIGERSCNTKQLGGLCSTQQGGVSPLSSRLTHLLPVYVSSQFAAPLCRFFFFFPCVCREWRSVGKGMLSLAKRVGRYGETLASCSSPLFFLIMLCFFFPTFHERASALLCFHLSFPVFCRRVEGHKLASISLFWSYRMRRKRGSRIAEGGGRGSLSRTVVRPLTL